MQPPDPYDASDMRANGGARLPWWQQENFDRNDEIVQRLTAIAEATGASLSQLALAWLLAQRPHIVPIPGSRNPGQVPRTWLRRPRARVHRSGRDRAAIRDGPYRARNATEVVWD